MRRTSPPSNRAMATVATVLAGAAGTAVGAFFQDRAKQLEHEREQRLSEIQRASALFRDLFDSLDAALYHNQEAMWVGLEGRQREDAALRSLSSWQKYSDALARWRTGEARRVAETSNYFGDDVGDSVEDLQGCFRKYETMVDATYYNKKDSKHFLVNRKGEPNDFRTRYFDGIYRPKMDCHVREIDMKLHGLAKTMSGLIQEEKVGIYNPQRREKINKQANAVEKVV